MSLFTLKLIIEVIGFGVLGYLSYSYIKAKKELNELKVKHKVTMDFADKLSKKLLALEKENRQAFKASANGSNGAVKKTYKKTRRSPKKKSPKTNNSGSNK